MKTKRVILLATIAALLIGLAACNRSYAPAKKSAAAPTPTNTEAAAGPTQILDQIYLLATQTALAQSAAQPTPGSETPLPTPPAGPGTEPTQPAVVTVQPTFVVVPTATPGLPATYVIQKGEHLYCIARRFNVNPAELMQLNGLGNLVSPGTEIKIPQTGNPFTGPRMLIPHPTTYVVKSGETIYSIACLFGDVSPEAIIFANGLTEPYTLTPGQVLQIP